MLLLGRDAMCWFVKLWSSLELFGMEFLSCTNTETKENGLIGISKDRVSPNHALLHVVTMLDCTTYMYVRMPCSNYGEEEGNCT